MMEEENVEERDRSANNQNMEPENPAYPEQENAPKHPMDAKIEEFAAEFLDLVIKGNGTSIQNWGSRFLVNLGGGVTAAVHVQYDVTVPQGR